MWRALLVAGVLLMSPVPWPAWPKIADQVLLEAPIERQRPELDNGCEVVSLSMLLRHAGKPVGRLKLAEEVAKDRTELRMDAQGRILYWGDPHRGFVGDITGLRKGYGVYHRPLFELLDRHLPGRARDLTGGDFERVLQSVTAGRPVVVWTTSMFDQTKQWVTWNSPSGPIYATFHEHAVLLVGYTAHTVTVNDPLDGKRKTVDRTRFYRSWEMMGRQAVTYE
ncbi:C39 family peptidase [Tumebacillus lipolyticus]|uniref:C39 family peptidase n=1 Tax=Tumebacillus lipolyticus TaxID=1280370 RepID=A0ABW4ZVT3_9BACL